MGGEGSLDGGDDFGIVANHQESSQMVDFKTIVSGLALVVVRIGISKTSKPSRMGDVSVMVKLNRRWWELIGDNGFFWFGKR